LRPPGRAHLSRDDLVGEAWLPHGVWEKRAHRAPGCDTVRAMRTPHLLLPLFLSAGAALAGPTLTTTPPASSTTTTPAAAPAKKKPTPADAKAFADKVNEELKKIYVDAARSEWVKETFITDDTDKIAADFEEKQMVYTADAIKKATAFDGLALDPETARTLLLLKISPDLPAPGDAKKASELADIASQLSSMYGKGKYCTKVKGKDDCRDLEQLSKVMGESRDYDKLLEAWNGWHTTSVPMRPLYEKYVALGNEGAKEIGFNDMSVLWKSRYDMPPAQFDDTMEHLWGQVKPLYDDLHCYVRGKLAQQYKGKVSDTGPIPAFLLGNMWAQEWSNIYPLVEPYKGQSSLDVTAALKKKKWTEKKLVELGENFFVSLGFDKLPDTFWTRSQFLHPKDHEAVCHASAWDVSYNKDLRVKMCIEVNDENLITIHHELGHIFYFQSYYKLPALFQQGAHDGVHEAIGDTIALSITPDYLKKVGILDSVAKNDKALINQQMKLALDKIAFLPFGLMMDKWRWDVFSGKTTPAEYNKHWWELRTKYQGIAPATARGEDNFDPGAKYHISANVPYARYFLSFIMQFQFHKALCQAAGFKGPLHECSIYGNKEAGAKLKAMLSMGASKPWQDAMQAMTGQRDMDASAILEYFGPLETWLKAQNKGKKCGW
jgi:peptidyl-dipeptidase A